MHFWTTLRGDAVRGNVSVNVLTAVKTLDADFAEVQQGGHIDVKWAFGDGVPSVADCDRHVPLMVRGDSS